MNNQTFQQIATSFSGILSDYRIAKKLFDQKIAAKQGQLDRLIKRKDRLRECPRWTELLLRPVIEMIKPQFPDWLCDDARLSPMGIGCRVSVFFTSKADDQKYIYIVFQPGDLGSGELLFETGESTDRYAKHTLGEISGFNRVTKPVESIEELVIFLQKQITNELN